MIIYRDRDCNEWWVLSQGKWWFGRGWKVKYINDVLTKYTDWKQDINGPSLQTILEGFVEISSKYDFEKATGERLELNDNSNHSIL